MKQVNSYERLFWSSTVVLAVLILYYFNPMYTCLDYLPRLAHQTAVLHPSRGNKCTTGCFGPGQLFPLTTGYLANVILGVGADLVAPQTLCQKL